MLFFTIRCALLSLAMCLIMPFCHAQNINEDSLLHVMDSLLVEARYSTLLPIVEAAVKNPNISAKSKLECKRHLIMVYASSSKKSYSEPQVKAIIEEARQQLKKGKSIDDTYRLIDILYSGSVYYANQSVGDEPKKSAALINEALVMFEKQEDKHKRPVKYFSLLNAQFLILQSIQASREDIEQALKKAMQLCKAHQNNKSIKYTHLLMNASNYYLDIGEYDLAETYGLEALAIQEKSMSKKHSDYAATVFNLANLYDELSQFTKSEKFYKEAITIRGEASGTRSIRYAAYLNNYAVSLRKQLRFVEAEKLYRECASIRKEQLGIKHRLYLSAISNLANLLRTQRKFSEADSMYRFAMSQHGGMSTDHNGSGLLCNYAVSKTLQKQYDSALWYYDIVAKANLKDNQVTTELYWQTNYANVLAELGYSHSADSVMEKLFASVIDFSQRNLPYLSESERIGFYETNIKAFIENYISHLINKYQREPSNYKILEKIYNLQLLNKSILLNETLKVKQIISSSQDQELIEAYNNWLLTKQELGKMNVGDQQRLEQNAFLDSLEEQASKLEKSISKCCKNFTELSQDKEVNLPDVKKTLQPREAAIEIVRIDKLKRNHVEKSKNLLVESQPFYAALIVRYDRPHLDIVLLDNGLMLENDFKNYHLNTSYYALKDTITYAKFWEPISKALEGIKKVFLASDGVYHQISLDCLYNTTSKQYLGEELSICRLTSTRELVNRGRPTRINSAVLMGNPTFMPSDTTLASRWWHKSTKLPATQIEIEVVGELLSKKKIKALTMSREEAAESALKLVGSPHILHLATHGLFQNNKSDAKSAMLNSALILSPDQEDDGLLTAFEAASLNLSETELVVLSGCETAMGKIQYGEGVYGLQRAFLAAGAKSLVMSLWRVDDHVTQVFIKYFYEELMVSKDKQKALKTAQRRVRKNYPEPFYWAAFILVGV